MEPINLTDDQRLYLQAIFDYFQMEVKWPTHKYLERQFIQTNPVIYIEELVQNLPSGLTNEVSLGYLDSKAYLTVPGVYQCQGSRQLLDAFVNVIEICVDTYFQSSDEQPYISSDAIKRYYPLWREPAIHKVGLLLQAEPGIWFSFSEGDNWTCQIAREIRRFRNVKTIEQYLEKRKIQRNIPGSMAVQHTMM